MTSKGDDVLGIHDVLLVLHVELVNTAVVGMCCDAVVGDAYGYPYGALAPLALANHFHDPYFVGVGDRKTFATAGKAVFADEVGHHLDGFASGFGTLKTECHEADVVDAFASAVEFLATAECGFGDGQLVLVDLTDYSISFRCFGDIAEVVVGVAVDDATHCALGMLGSGVVL